MDDAVQLVVEQSVQPVQSCTQVFAVIVLLHPDTDTEPDCILYPELQILQLYTFLEELVSEP